MENNERVDVRDCVNCQHYKHYKEDIFACESWECKYEPRDKEG